MSGVPDIGGASPHKVEHEELRQSPWLEDPVGRSEDLGQFLAEWLRWTGLFGRNYARRSDRSYDKVHFLFHAVVEWVSCSGGDSTGVRWGSGLAEGGRRWAGLAVGRSARAGFMCGQAVIGRAGRGRAWSVRAGSGRHPQLHRVHKVVGRVGGYGRRSGHAVSGLKSNASGASRS